MRKTTCFKQLILDDEILVLPGAYDALSAKIVERAGFKAVTLGGYPASACLLAKPDVSLLSLSEMVDHLRDIVDAVDIPVFGDGGTGQGNVTNVARTIQLFENAGAAGLFIEDQVFPKRCGHMEGKQVVLIEEMCAKIRAAVDTRRDQDLVIMARTDALAVCGLEAAIERGNRYREAGADLIFIEAPQSIDDMRRITKEVNTPLLANMVEGGKTPIFSAGELQAIGYSAVAFPLSTLYAAAWALREIMRKLAREGSTQSHFTVIHPVFVNQKFWNSLPADLQKTIKDCARTVQKQSIADSEKAKDTAIAELKKKMTIHIQTPEEAKLWRQVMQKPALDYFLEKTGQEGSDLVDLIKKIGQ